MTKRLMITSIAMTVVALHFIKGENYQGPFPIFVNGYLIDILLPMALYLLMSLFQNKLIRSPLFRACAVFGFGCFVEASQYFERPIFGSTFDPLDVVAYAGGVLWSVTRLGFVPAVNPALVKPIKEMKSHKYFEYIQENNHVRN